MCEGEGEEEAVGIVVERGYLLITAYWHIQVNVEGVI
jgi:hypothetical protein